MGIFNIMSCLKLSSEQARVCRVQKREDPWCSLQQNWKKAHFTGGGQLSNFGRCKGTRSGSGNTSNVAF